MESIVTAVNQMGFPIVAYLLIYRLSKKTIEENTLAVRDMQAELERYFDDD